MAHVAHEADALFRRARFANMIVRLQKRDEHLFGDCAHDWSDVCKPFDDAARKTRRKQGHGAETPNERRLPQSIRKLHRLQGGTRPMRNAGLFLVPIRDRHVDLNLEGPDEVCVLDQIDGSFVQKMSPSVSSDFKDQ